jgi:hypothetical protein
MPDSHWYWHCPFKTQASPQRYVLGDQPDADVVLSSENGRFERFVAILQEYVANGIATVRMSNLGMLLRERYVYAEKTGLKPLVERGVEEGIVVRQGDQGLAELVLLPGKIEEFIMRIEMRMIEERPTAAASVKQPYPPPPLYAAFAALLRSYAIGDEATLTEANLLPRIRERLIGASAEDLEALLCMAEKDELVRRSQDGTCVVSSPEKTT